MVAGIAISQVYREGGEWRLKRLRALSRHSKRVEKMRIALGRLCSVSDRNDGVFRVLKGVNELSGKEVVN